MTEVMQDFIESIEQFNEMETEESFNQMVTRLIKCMMEEEIFYSPVVIEDQDEETGMSSVRVGHLALDLDENGIQKPWLPVFTARDEVGTDAPSMKDIHGFSMETLFSVAKDSNSEGIVINPANQFFLIPEMLINSITECIEDASDENEDEGMVINLYHGDITELYVDAIVNAANNTLLGGSGVDGAIHKAAGPELLEECRVLKGCSTGEAKVTNGYNLDAKYVIHTVGPIYSGKSEDAVLLANCYINSLDLAMDKDVHSIAFPAISTGVFGYPKEEAAEIAVGAVFQWMEENYDYDIDITFCLFDEENMDIYQSILENDHEFEL